MNTKSTNKKKSPENFPLELSSGKLKPIQLDHSTKSEKNIQLSINTKFPAIGFSI